MIAHLLIVGPLEAIVTAMAVGYVQRANLVVLPTAAPQPARVARAGRDGGRRWLWITAAILLLLVVASPLGSLASGTAWGEWSAKDLHSTLGYVPQGVESVSGLWTGVLSDYNIPGWDSDVLNRLGYLISALVGVVVVGVVSLVFGKVLGAKGKRHEHS